MAIEFDNDEFELPQARPAPKRKSLNDLLVRSAQPIPLRDRMAFDEQLALLLETGVPLHTALGELENQTDNAEVRGILSAIRDEIIEGVSMASAMSHHPRMFNTTYTNIIASGEAGGFLPSALQQLMELDEKTQRLRGVVSSALTYPMVLLVTSVLVVGFVLLWVFPKFTELFASMGDNLPFLTALLMRISAGIRDYWLALLAALGIVGGVIWHSLRQPEVRERLDRLLLNLPLIGPVLIQVHLVPTLRVLSLSLANAVPVLKALTATREVTTSAAFRAMIDRAIQNIEEGQSLSKVFAESRFMPSLAREMIITGEATGNLALVMGRLCDYYQKQLEQRLQMLAKLSEPLMLLIMSLVIGGIVSALILPIFKLATTAH
ncbi:MAG: type II secretion system F family protein [Rhodocyclaceae bacterium]|nr:type II secretion system F family protein [Rhodocyclaceae bacterium]